MSTASGFLLADARRALERTLSRRPQTDHAIVFGYWISLRAGDTQEANTIAGAAVQRTGAQLDFQTVATLGFAMASGLLDRGASGTLRQGLERLAGRQPFVDEIPMPFCSDAVGILGVAMGTRSVADDQVTSRIVAWLSSFMPTIYHLEGIEDWQRCLFRAADFILGRKIELSGPPISQSEDVALALAAKNVLPRNEGMQAQQEEEQALKLILLEGASEIFYERAAIRLVALDYVTRAAPTVVPGRLSASDLVHLLNRIPAGLRKWTWELKPRTASVPSRHWHIDHEYHVQNLLWVVLSPILPDLDDEQYLVKIGQKSPRADLYIPSMRIVVEAKFLRAGDKMQKVIDEISSDASMYSAMGNDCAGIVPVIWDDSARSHEHDYLKQGLRRLPNIVDAVVVSRPSDWIRGASKVPTRTLKAKKDKKIS